MTDDNHKIRQKPMFNHFCNRDEIISVQLSLEQTNVGREFLKKLVGHYQIYIETNSPPDYNRIRRGISALAECLIETDKEEILKDVCWALSFISDTGHNIIKQIVNIEGLVKKIIMLLGHEEISIIVPCLRIIGNIVTGDDIITQYVIDQGALQMLDGLIFNNKNIIRKEVCWSISNITAGTSQQIQKCIERGIIDKLLNLMTHDKLEIRKEVVWVVGNCTASATPEQFYELVKRGVLKALCESLKINEPRILTVILQSIQNILESGKQHFQNGHNKFAEELERIGGLDMIEQLQTHSNHKIYENALDILDKYFTKESDQIFQLKNYSLNYSDSALIFKF